MVSSAAALAPPDLLEADRLPHPPIAIVGDEGFLRPGSGVVNPDAEGTAEDPYVIEGWDIRLVPPDVDDSAPHVPGVDFDPLAGVSLFDTTKHVVIRGILVDGFLHLPVGEATYQADRDWVVRGIALHGAANVALEGNEVRNLPRGSEGILLSGTTHTRVVANHVHHVSQDDISRWANGIRVHDTRDTLVVGNLVHDIRGADAIHVSSGGSERVVVEDNVIRDAEGAGIYVWSMTDLEVVSNDISVEGIGVWVRSSSDIQVSGNLIQARDGVSVGSGRDILVSSNRILGSGDGDGISVSGGTDVVGNLIEGHRSDIEARQTSPGGQVVFNTVRDSSTGIVLNANAQQVRWNLFQDNNVGVRVQDLSPDVLPVIHGNDFVGNRVTGLRSTLADTLDATGNWWGCPEGPGAPGCDGVEGDLVVAPWRNAPVPGAGVPVN